MEILYKGTDTLVTAENCLEHGFESVEEYNKYTICAPYIPSFFQNNSLETQVGNGQQRNDELDTES